MIGIMVAARLHGAEAAHTRVPCITTTTTAAAAATTTTTTNATIKSITMMRIMETVCLQGKEGVAALHMRGCLVILPLLNHHHSHFHH